MLKVYANVMDNLMTTHPPKDSLCLLTHYSPIRSYTVITDVLYLLLHEIAMEILYALRIKYLVLTIHKCFFFLLYQQSICVNVRVIQRVFNKFIYFASKSAEQS